MSSNIQLALDESARVLKKQKTCASKVEGCIDQLIALTHAARSQAASGAGVRELEAGGLMKDMNAQTKDLHLAVGKLGKAVDKAFDPQVDICKALRDLTFDQATVNKVIAEHLYREGRFDLGDVFVAEAGVAGAGELKQPYQHMHEVLQQIRAHNLGPALAWALRYREQLSPDGSPGAFEFRLHSLQFLSLLASPGGQAAALAYARSTFGAFQRRHLREIQRLMGCLLYYHRAGAEGAAAAAAPAPYSDLLSPSRWEDLASEFSKQACSLLGQAYESPLAVTVAAGAVALPAMLKLAALLERKGQVLAPGEQLPVEVELGEEFVFHSIFSCPVSKDQSTPENPPMLLPCNHVLCQQSIDKIAKGRSRVFKCPYCPVEARADNLRPITFPDAL